MKILMQNGKAIRMNENTVLENEVLTKRGLEELYKGNMDAFGKVGKLISIVSIVMLLLFSIVPMIIMISTGMTFEDMLPIIGCVVVMVLLAVLAHTLPQKAIQRKYDAIVEGRFRFLSDTIADKTVHRHHDSDSHITTYTYCIKGVKHPEERRMFDAWWTVSQIGDEVYMFEIANKKGKYRACDVFPAKVFTLDSELEAYVDRDSIMVGGFEK